MAIHSSIAFVAFEMIAFILTLAIAWSYPSKFLLIAVCLILLLIAVTIYYFYHRILYEITLHYNIAWNKFDPSTWPWWSRVSDQIILGAIPLKNLHHLESLCQAHHIKAVLSILEPFELEASGFSTQPVSRSDWEAHGIIYKQIIAQDFQPLTNHQIAEGVKFIETQIKQGHKVYVHCKAGRGRSSAILACYLLQHGEQSSVEEALAYLTACRKQVLLTPRQKKAIDSYYHEIIIPCEQT